MAKSKQAPALFEVIQSQRDKKQPDKLAVPKWFGKSEEGDGAETPEAPRETPAPTEAPAAPTESELALPASGSSSGGMAAPSAPPAPAPVRRLSVAETADDRPLRPVIVRVHAGRVELSLNPVSAVVAVCGVVLAVMCSYELGQRLGASEPERGPLQADRQDYSDEGVENFLRTDVFEVEPDAGRQAQPPGPAPKREAAPVPQPTETAERVAGLNYVVIESFRAEHEEDARHAQDWLAERNIGTTLEPTSDGAWWRLISTNGFDYTDPAQKRDCEQYRQAIIGLGSEYRDKFAKVREIRYTFRDPAPEKW